MLLVESVADTVAKNCSCSIVGYDRQSEAGSALRLKLLGQYAGVPCLFMDEAATLSIKTTRLRHLQRFARLSYLDPVIVRSILAGTLPKSLSSRRLWRMADLPIRFADQHKVLEFPSS